MQSLRPAIRPLPRAVSSRLNRKLYLDRTHPIGITNLLLQNFFADKFGIASFQTPLDPAVSVTQAFDELLIAADHPSRSPSDTFYVDEARVLRPQSTCYQRLALEEIRRTLPSSPESVRGRVWACDVYRRDEVDRTHFPVFHQMDGVKLFDASVVSEKAAVQDLKTTLEQAVLHLHALADLPTPSAMKWISDVTFPFTHPSFELEVDGVELLGCGLARQELLLPGERGWAFGVGLERLAMRLFGIDDIRIFWSEDERILSQFRESEIKKFEHVNNLKFPAVQRDLSFWLNANFETNEFYEICRDVLEEWSTLESVLLVDDYRNPEGRRSLCFRLTYRSLDKTLTNEEVNQWHACVAERVVKQLDVLIR